MKAIVGIGESVASLVIAPVLAILKDAMPYFIGKSAYDGNRLIGEYYQVGFNARGTRSAPRYSQALAGIELALWDAIAKAAGQPCTAFSAAARCAARSAIVGTC